MSTHTPCSEQVRASSVHPSCVSTTWTSRTTVPTSPRAAATRCVTRYVPGTLVSTASSPPTCSTSPDTSPSRMSTALTPGSTKAVPASTTSGEAPSSVSCGGGSSSHTAAGRRASQGASAHLPSSPLQAQETPATLGSPAAHGVYSAT